MQIALERDHRLYGKISNSEKQNLHLTVALYKDEPEVKDYFSCCGCSTFLSRLIPHSPVILSTTNGKISDYTISAHDIDDMLHSLHTGEIACMECLDTYLDEELVFQLHLEHLEC